MKFHRYICTLFFAYIVFFIQGSYALPAFPGAQGFGSESVGGRGGAIIKVTNLNDSGEGSFRSAVMSSGARIVVFEVSGIINLKSQIYVKNPYLTVAGETSPGGVLITGFPFYLSTNDVVIRHMRFRVGSHRITDGSNADPETLDSFGIWGDSVPGGAGNDAYNIILDHVSLGWGVDENMGISYRAHDITIQRSIIANALENAGHPKGEHSKGLLISQKFKGSANISVHHNLFAHNRDRNPLVSGETPNSADIRNNVIYNGYHGMSGVLVGGNAGANIIHNYIKGGPDTSKGAYEAGYWDGPPAQSNMIYTEGNLGLNRTSQDQDEWVVADEWRSSPAPSSYRKLTPWDSAFVTTTEAGPEMASDIVADVGATIPVRDSVDLKTVADYNQGVGTYTSNVFYPADFPVFATPSPPQDMDNDGMADSWELANGLNISINDSAADKDGDGYTNIEEYLHFLARGGVNVATAVPPHNFTGKSIQ